MKRPVSIVASLVVVLGMATACGGPPGKTNIASACGEKSTGLDCACFADALEKGLPAEKFSRVAQMVEDNRRDPTFLPTSLADDEEIHGKITEATASCPKA